MAARRRRRAAQLALPHGISGFVVVADDPVTIELIASEVAPAARELVATERRAKST